MRSPRRTLAASTLVLEAFVLLFAALVAKDLSDLSPATALAGGGALSVLCLVTAGLLRTRAGYAVGWIVQVLMVATGLFVPMMFGIGLLFTALWSVCLYQGARIERERAIVERGLAARRAAAESAESAESAEQG